LTSQFYEGYNSVKSRNPRHW